MACTSRIVATLRMNAGTSKTAKAWMANALIAVGNRASRIAFATAHIGTLSIARVQHIATTVKASKPDLADAVVGRASGVTATSRRRQTQGVAVGLDAEAVLAAKTGKTFAGAVREIGIAATLWGRECTAAVEERDELQ